MKKITVDKMEFTILETPEEIVAHYNCKHEYRDVMTNVLINPNLEYVVGYGNHAVSVSVKSDERCCRCGFLRSMYDPEFAAKMKGTKWRIETT